MLDSDFLDLLDQAEADAMRRHLPWSAPLRELHGQVAGTLEQLEVRVAALEEAAAGAAPAHTAPAGPRRQLAAAVGFKQCRRCQQVMPLHSFNRLAASKDGHNHWCAACWRKYQRDRRCAIQAKHLAAAADAAKAEHDGAVADYYGETIRPATAERETVVAAGIGVYPGRQRKAS